MFRFGDQVNVVVLHGELEDTELPARGCAKGTAHGREDAAGPEAADGLDRTERHVHRMGGGMFGPSPVRHPAPTSGRELPSGAGAPPAPRAGRG